MQEKIESIHQAQLEMRTNYMNGATGILVSGFVWLLSGVFAYTMSSTQAIWTLLIGGAAIFPLSMLLTKLLGYSGTHSKGNPLGSLAMQGTFFMLLCIPLAYGLSLQRTEWFFMAMLVIIGGRYFTFNTIYGKRFYWILGAALALAAYLLLITNAKPYVCAFAGALIEIVLGIFLLLSFYRERKFEIASGNWKVNLGSGDEKVF